MPPTVTRQTGNSVAKPGPPAPRTPARKPGVPAAGGVLSRITPLDEGGQYLKCLFYGQSGSGKTTLWATFPGPILVAIASGGLNPGELKSVDTAENRDKISKVVLHKSDDMKELVGHVRDTGAFETFVLDHVTGFADMILAELLGLEEIPAQKGWGLASQQQYGQATLQAKEHLKRMLGLNCNVVIIGQERTFGGGDDGASDEILKPVVGVAASPSLAGWLNPAADYVIQLFKRPKTKAVQQKIGDKTVTTQVRDKGVEYCARLEPHDRYMTKFRVPRGGKIPDVLVDPDYTKLMNIVKAAQGK